MPYISVIAFMIATISLAVSPAQAQNLAWRSAVTMDVPAGAGIDTANAMLDDPASNRLVAMITNESAYAENYRYRAMATDTSTGDLVWSAELGSECQTRSGAYSLVVPIAGGDVVVVAQAIGSTSIGYGFTCVMRLRGADGSVVWSRSLSASGAVLYVNALVPDVDGNLFGGGRKGANAYSLRLDAGTGQTLWEQDIAPTSGFSSARIIAAAAGSTNAAVLQLVEQVTTVPTHQRLLGIDPRAGTSRWTQPRCMDGAATTQNASNDIRLRMLADATFEFVASCGNGAERRVELGRVNASTGTILWQRELPQSNLYRAFIDTNGNFLLDGTLLVDGNEVGISRLDAVSGDLQWSLPRPSVPPGVPPYVTNRLLATDTHVHVLELFVEYSSYVTSAAVATYSATMGEFLGRFDAGFPSAGSALWPGLSMRARGSGEVLITALSAQNLNAGASLFEVRLNVYAQLSAWSRKLPLMAPRPFVPLSADESMRQMAWSSAQEPGIVLGGSGTNQNNYTYPRVAKISALDGRVLWRWQTDSRARGFVSSVFDDAAGNIIVAGSNGWDDPTLLLAKLDGADGSSIWESSVPEPRPALDAISGSDGTIVVLLGHVEAESGLPNRVAKYSASDGSPVWSTAIPDSVEGDIGESRLAPGQGGSVLAMTRFRASSSVFGSQVARFNNTNGEMLWLRRLQNSDGSGPIALLSAANGDVIAANHGFAWRIGGATGVILWQKALPHQAWSMIVDAQDQLLIGGTQNGQRAISRINPANGTALWTTLIPILNDEGHPELVSKLSHSYDDNVFAVGGDEYGNDMLAKLSPLNGSLIWQTVSGVREPFSDMSGFPVSMIEAPDHNLFVSGMDSRSPSTWAVSKVTGSFADGIFATGFD